MISIITPCRNSEKTIRRTIESVINQGIEDYEYIIVDGLSDDTTMEIVKKYAQKNNKIKFISERDNSMTEALNKGFQMATGEIICSINADDEYLPGTLIKVEEIFAQKCVDVLVGSTHFIKNDQLFFSTFPKYMTNRVMLNILDCSAPESSIFLKKSAVESVGYFDEKYKYTQDYELYIRLASKGYKFEFMKDIASNFYLSTEQYSTTAYEDMLDESCLYNEYPWLFKWLKKTHLNNVIKRLFGWTKMA